MQQFTVDLETLNSDFGSTASGFANITLDAPSENIRTVRVQVDADGLEDLSGIGGVHVAHIHGQFLGNADDPLLEQGNGSFFTGTGGTAADSILPTLESSDVDGDGFINFLEGRPSYGPVVLNLTSEQIEAAPDGTPPLSYFLELAQAGEINPAELFPSGTEFNLDTTYTFDLTDPDQLRQFNNLNPLDEREIVLHGLTVPLELSQAIDETAMGTAPAGTDLEDGEAFRITAPVAAGTIKPLLPDIIMNNTFLALTDDNSLISFDPSTPGDTEAIAITGVDAPILGIDTRPANGLVYGIDTSNNIYTIDPDSGAATYISTLDTPFEGGTISGFDFNPVADRLRLVGDNDQDFRINVETGEVTVDGDLAFAEGDVNAGVNPNITAAGYTNAFDGTESTQLYDIDTLLNQLVLQSPPNDGTLVTIGDLGVDFDTLGGFDIVSGGTEGDNAAFAVSDGVLYSVDLGSGMASVLGEIDSEGSNLQGLATVPNMSMVSEIADFALNSTFLALTDSNVILSFAPDSPEDAAFIEVTGVDGFLLGIDTRPANGLVYGIDTSNNIYTIDPDSGAATYISTLDTPFEGGTISGFDFNPVADRLRLVGDNDQDFRINVETGEVIVDGDLAFADGDVNAGINPNVTAAGYTNSFDGTESTQLYDIDTLLNQLVLQSPPNDGTLVTVGDLGVDFDTLGGFDIVSGGAEGQNAAFAVSDGVLYSVDLSSGMASVLGEIGTEFDNLQGLATVPNAPAVSSVQQILDSSNFVALTDSNTLVSFPTDSPGDATLIEVTGVDGFLLGIDTRPANGLIYSIDTSNNIYTIDPDSGEATYVSTLDTPFEGGTISGFDFNPAADRLRLVGDNDQDFRINVETGGVTVDGDLAFAEGDINEGVNPNVTAAAYTNAFDGTESTQLYDIDTLLNDLVLQSPPNDGTLVTVGDLGFDIDTLGGFDIVSSPDGGNAAFAVSNSTLYTIDLNSGAASSVGEIGMDDLNLQGFTLALNSGDDSFIEISADSDMI